MGIVTNRRAYCPTHGWVNPQKTLTTYTCPKCNRYLNDSEWTITTKQRKNGAKRTLTLK